VIAASVTCSAFTVAAMKTSTAVTVAGVTVATGALVYAIYFDYKRRNDTGFRKKLRESNSAVRYGSTPTDSYASL